MVISKEENAKFTYWPTILNFQNSTILPPNLNSAAQKTGGGRNLERRNLERPIFQDFKIANIKIKKDKLFDIFILEFIFLIF